MNFIDIFLILIVLLCIWSGWRKGFIAAGLQLVLWFGSLVVGFLLYKYTAAFIERLFNNLGVWLYPLAFIATVIMVRIIVSFIIRRLFTAIPKQTHYNIFNKILGVIPGVLNGIIYTIIIVAILFSLPLLDGLSRETRESKIADKAAVQVEWLDEKLSPVFDEAVKKTLNKLTVEPGSTETVKLHFTVTNPVAKSDLEAEMLEMVNNERVKVGLHPLKADPELTIVARAHSRDMFARGYFSHYTPEGKDPFDRMRAARVRFITAGENLAMGRTLSICHKGLMNSPGHRANILRPAFGRLGIGVLDGGMYGLMISQEFRN
jgi:uncharacterized protein YkwD